MRTFHPAPFRRRLHLCLLSGLLLCSIGAPAWAEKADRFKKMEVESDQPGKVDLQNQIVVFNGNVVVTKGTMVIRAGRIEVRESPEGYQYATAIGTPGKLATFRQKREGLDEYIEGEAERLEYDSKADTIRFIGKASVKRLRGDSVADEVTGALITYDNTAELFTVAGGASAATPANPTGRVRAVLSPRQGTPAAAEAASAAASGASR
ncbi:MAG: lipopolysaccharide transport periplasmic protein LptA [Rhizobacter sp.]|nr:lipopolysaccharide transport periplasmic protein LptA [Rhizobacter sp.]